MALLLYLFSVGRGGGDRQNLIVVVRADDHFTEMEIDGLRGRES